MGSVNKFFESKKCLLHTLIKRFALCIPIDSFLSIEQLIKDYHY